MSSARRWIGAAKSWGWPPSATYSAEFLIGGYQGSWFLERAADGVARLRQPFRDDDARRLCDAVMTMSVTNGKD